MTELTDHHVATVWGLHDYSLPSLRPAVIHLPMLEVRQDLQLCLGVFLATSRCSIRYKSFGLHGPGSVEDGGCQHCV